MDIELQWKPFIPAAYDGSAIWRRCMSNRPLIEMNTANVPIALPLPVVGATAGEGWLLTAVDAAKSGGIRVVQTCGVGK